MKNCLLKKFEVLLIMVATCLNSSMAYAQFGQPRAPQINSTEVTDTGNIIFRIYAPQAGEVLLTGPRDIEEIGDSVRMQRDEEGIWSVVLNPVKGSYRYSFNVDGVSVIDPENPVTSESNMNTWSMVHIPGKKFMDTLDIQHGAVAQVTYYSSSLGKFRRMHIYTPPGYGNSRRRYPVFYLLHGAMDSDASWSTVGRAGFIVDNLIAEKKIKPMVVVMPDGHTGSFTMGRDQLPDKEFVMDFNNDIMPYVEENYRVYRKRKYRAIAGLSMGGVHTLDIAIPNLEKFAYIGVFSSGVFGITAQGPERPADQDRPYEEHYQEFLSNDRLKRDLKLFWFSTGEDDFLIDTTRATVAMFRNYGFDPVYEETGGGHTWINWRNYLHEFVQLLYR